jgi:multidrug efflux pump subunit AcrB
LYVKALVLKDDATTVVIVTVDAVAIAAVLVSLFVSFSLDPMLSAYWPDPHLRTEDRWFISRWLVRFNEWFDRQANRYKGIIGWALDHRFTMAALAVLSLVGALALPALGIVGGEFIPVSDNSEMLINIETPPGSNLAYTKVKAEEAARLARDLRRGDAGADDARPARVGASRLSRADAATRQGLRRRRAREPHPARQAHRRRARSP